MPLCSPPSSASSATNQKGTNQPDLGWIGMHVRVVRTLQASGIPIPDAQSSTSGTPPTQTVETHLELCGTLISMPVEEIDDIVLVSAFR